MDSKLTESSFMAKNNKLHIAMFPWLALGHLIPYLELAKLIAKKGHTISFISTPRNIDRLQKLTPDLVPLIHFVKLPLPHVENLSRDAEATSDLPLKDIGLLEKAYDLLQEPLSQFLQSSHPNWILFDFSPYWLPTIARKLNIPTCFFSIFIAASLCYICPASGDEDHRRVVEDYTVKPKWITIPSSVSYRLFESIKLFPAMTGNGENVPLPFRFRETLKGCDLVAVRTCIEVEHDYLNLLEQLHRKPVIPIGVLPNQTSDDDDETIDTHWRCIKEFLDNKEKGSVVYVAFGSEAKPNQEELNEIALGLELSGLPFFWVLRKRRGAADTEVVELPDGFEERVKSRGVVFTSWAPQMKILAHDSVGGLLTHSGWSSVVEALQFARALVLLTFYADQGLNAKVFEEKKVGFLVPRQEHDGSFTRKSVAESLRMVIVEEEGKVYRDKAKELKGLLGDVHRQNLLVENFLDHLQTRKCMKKSHEING
uniref:Anthocyanidin 3-O-glucosyltransferase n=1 Tax=Salix viminalis TaxID=40686 RepID=A0A6N2KUI2_SALVM